MTNDHRSVTGNVAGSRDVSGHRNAGADTAGGEDATSGEGREGEGDELWGRLVQAAAEVFAREGYAGAKILDIVSEAEVSTGAVYGRFQSKNDLLRQAIVHRSARGGMLASGADSLGDLIRHGARMVDRPLYSFEAMRLEAYVTARRDDEVAAALSDAYTRWREGVEPLVAAAKEAGALDEGLDPEAVLFLYRTLYLGLLLHRGSGLAGPDPEGWEDLVERLVASLGRPDTSGSGVSERRIPRSRTPEDRSARPR